MTGDLWPFSLRFYDDPQVQAACLGLQDQHGADVNVALCLLWHAGAGLCLTDADVARIDAAVADWRSEVVQPLRAMRRKLKVVALVQDTGLQMAFRDKIKDLELRSERAEQEILGALEISAQMTQDPAAAARHNLMAYGRLLSSAIAPDITEILVGRLQQLVRTQ